uniref:Uncharacterized protein n=1 Tax=Knipowitschia caucasica TaxID=637954 RepID=A0AAV2MHD9_KNICA
MYYISVRTPSATLPLCTFISDTNILTRGKGGGERVPFKSQGEAIEAAGRPLTHTRHPESFKLEVTAGRACEGPDSTALFLSSPSESSLTPLEEADPTPRCTNRTSGGPQPQRGHDTLTLLRVPLAPPTPCPRPFKCHLKQREESEAWEIVVICPASHVVCMESLRPFRGLP